METGERTTAVLAGERRVDRGSDLSFAFIGPLAAMFAVAALAAIVGPVDGVVVAL